MFPLQYTIVSLAAGAILFVCTIADINLADRYDNPESDIKHPLLFGAAIGVIAGLLLSAAGNLGLLETAETVGIGAGVGFGFAGLLTLAFYGSASLDAEMIFGASWPYKVRKDVKRALLECAPEEVNTTIKLAAAAASGGVIGSLVSQNIFWGAIEEIVQPRGIFAAVVMVIISMSLFDPVRASVLGHKEGEHEAAHESQTKSAARVTVLWGTRLFFIIALEIIYVSLDHCVGDRSLPDSESTFYTVLIAGLAPAIVTFYWASLIQFKDEDRWADAVVASSAAAALLSFPSASLGPVFNFLETSWGVLLAPFHFAFDLFIALVEAAILGFLACGLYASAFLVLLWKGRPSYGFFLVGPALLVAATIKIAILYGIAYVFGAADDMNFGAGLMAEYFAVVGWFAAIVAAGFHHLVRPAAPAATST
jgi:hypothetical protein